MKCSYFYNHKKLHNFKGEKDVYKALAKILIFFISIKRSKDNRVREIKEVFTKIDCFKAYMIAIDISAFKFHSSIKNDKFKTRI